VRSSAGGRRVRLEAYGSRFAGTTTVERRVRTVTVMNESTTDVRVANNIPHAPDNEPEACLGARRT
jgi:hypothetical protein